MKKIEEILKELDQLFADNKAKEAEKFLLECLTEAEEASDLSMQLQLYNELIGYYRVTSEKEKLLHVIAQAMEIAGELQLKGTLPYATTALNAANGYRSIGDYESSKKYYSIVEEIYLKTLSWDDMLLAGLYNNISLLYQEISDYRKAMDYLLKALEIVVAQKADFEIAVTYANLANTAVLEKDYEKAKDYAMRAIACFDKMKLYDAHYCAALSALGMCFYAGHAYEEASSYFEKAMKIVHDMFGENSQYQRLKNNYDLCKEIIAENKNKAEADPGKDIETKMYSKKHSDNDCAKKVKGMELCKAYYDTYGAPMIHEKFSDYETKIAVGLAGEGSDCFGYDDGISRDHDWGPDFCLWLDDETYDEIGMKLQEEYEKLPDEFQGYHRTISKNGMGRRGVCRISDFYKRILGEENYPQIQWEKVEDYALATASNGMVFRDDEGKFLAFRNEIKKGYPQNIRFLKLADGVAKVCQTGQYNYFRMMERGDFLSADRMLSDCIGHAMKLQHYICNVYPVHDKWLRVSTQKLENGQQLLAILKDLHACLNKNDSKVVQTVRDLTNRLGDFFARELYEHDDISDIENYLDVHTDELVVKAGYSVLSKEKLVTEIAKTEFQAFDKVKNKGGRASCQNDWPTFSVMRRSQYLTWNQTMLLQYIYDFKRELSLGHNLITEKYGRMMESTAPDEYENIKNEFPPLSDEKKAVIEQIVAIQMTMAEEFAKAHPKVFMNARSLHTYEDNLINTSYETYLRGEISTYSDKMLQLYARYVVECFQMHKNIARMTMENTAMLYGYKNIDEFEASIK